MSSKKYYRLILGVGNMHAGACREGNFVGADFDIEQDLSNDLPEQWKDFNQKFIPIWMESHPEKSKVSAGLSCGALWTIAKGIQKGDIVLCPDGTGMYQVGEVTGDYEYRPGEVLPHCRSVRWFDTTFARSDMGEDLRNSSGSISTVCRLTKYADEIESLIAGETTGGLISTDETVEDPSVFALEKHLEDFLVENWQQTEFGRTHDIFEEDGELIGQQYLSDTGPIDILAISKDKKELLVVELKKGRASDNVVGQIQRYMGYVLAELAEDDQTVRGVIIALEDDLRIQRALAVASDIDFYKYQVSFNLFRG